MQVLLDPGTFLESGALVQQRRSDPHAGQQQYHGGWVGTVEPVVIVQVRVFGGVRMRVEDVCAHWRR